MTGHISEEMLYDLAEFFKVFGDTTRIKIINELSKQELSVNKLADTINSSQSAVSHQLRLLKQAKIVKHRRDGKTIFYSLDDDHVIDIFNTGLEHLNHN